MNDHHTLVFSKLVKEFMETFNQKIYRRVKEAPSILFTLRANLIEEEADEFEAARKTNNKLEMLDGLCDLAYVTAGTLISLSLTTISFTAYTQRNRDLSRLADACIDNLRQGVPCSIRLFTSLNDLLIAVASYDYDSFDLFGAFKAVHENNMKKLWDREPTSNELIRQMRPNGKWLVMRTDYKVVKPPDHKKVDLTSFLKAPSRGPQHSTNVAAS